jgi:hypothetical protein
MIELFGLVLMLIGANTIVGWIFNLFHVRDEGESIRQGFNFYRLSDKHSFGFILRIGEWYKLVRRSKLLHRWILVSWKGAWSDDHANGYGDKK